MKADFILKFIESIVETGKELHNIWSWQPIYYKGIHISGPEYKKHYRGFKNLENRGLVVKKSEKFKFSNKGKKWFQGALIKYLKLDYKKWDKKWRLIIFDIPQELHRERIKFRTKLKIFGFYQLQKSVFIFPYPCEEEISEVAKLFKVSDYINILITESAGYTEEEILKFYNL